MSNSLSNNIETMFNKMENFVSSKTVVGEPVHIDGVIIVPLVDVSFGMGASGSEAARDEKAKKGGSMGGVGAKISPSAILVIINGTVQLVNVKNQNSVNKLIDLIPGVMSKFDFSGITGKNKDSASDSEVID